MGHTVLGNAARAYKRRNRITEWNVEWLFGPGGMPLPNVGSMDGNTGRSEGATAEKAGPSPGPVLDPNRSFVELRVREPRQGLVAFRHLQKSLNRSSASSAFAASLYAPSLNRHGNIVPLGSMLAVFDKK